MALFEKEIKDLIAAQGFQDSSANTPSYFIAMEQKDPAFAVTVIPESGNPGTKRISEFPSFSVRVRHTNAAEANLFLRRIFEFLQEYQGRLGTSPTWPVARISADATPVQIGRDRDGRQGRWRVQQTFNAITRFVTQP
jgi:hypothetical protein